MTADLYSTLSKYTFYALMAFTFVVLGLFYGVGFGNTEVINGNDMTSPEYTDLLIYWMYILMAAAVVLVLVFGIIAYFKKFKDSPKEAIKSLLGVILLVVVFAVAYAMSSDAPIMINGQVESNANILVMTDLFIYVQYALFTVCTLATLVSLSGVLKSVNKVKA